MAGILFAFHCQSNAGYAIAKLERAFLFAAKHSGFAADQIHFSYADLSGGVPDHLTHIANNIYKVAPRTIERSELQRVRSIVAQRAISLVVGFDQQPKLPLFRAMRSGGVRRIISYWGAPMGSLNGRFKRFAKRLDMLTDFWGPDEYIFESEAMRATAILGRGIHPSKTRVIHLAVDTTTFAPPPAPDFYAHDVFGIPREDRIVFYSGHMEPRKGVDVIMQAAVILLSESPELNVHFLLCGDADKDRERLEAIVSGTGAASKVIFAGYRHDVDRLMRSATLGVIASTGWDSFTMSSIEMASTGLPLVVSDLQGLAESIEDKLTGFLVPPGDPSALSRRIRLLLNDSALRQRLGEMARRRVIENFSLERQIEQLAARFTLGDSE
jgi:glycosyltransferase involved in cell wall biosynthesis